MKTRKLRGYTTRTGVLAERRPASGSNAYIEMWLS
jgi:hypothetical protein